nr:SWIM zinc finger family protein [uncultured Kingella sp.]
MSGIYLPRLFPPHIAERGLLYFQQGKVRDVQKTSAGRYRAEVCGSENYSVWLKLDSDLYIKDGGCDCPYGWACKHMAALWYAVREQTPDKQAEESGVQQPEIILFVSCSNTKGYLKTIFQVAFLLGADVD